MNTEKPDNPIEGPFQVTPQTNERWSIYTDHGHASMADETLVGWDVEDEEEARRFASFSHLHPQNPNRQVRPAVIEDRWYIIAGRGPMQSKDGRTAFRTLHGHTYWAGPEQVMRPAPPQVRHQYLEANLRVHQERLFDKMYCFTLEVRDYLFQQKDDRTVRELIDEFMADLSLIRRYEPVWDALNHIQDLVGDTITIGRLRRFVRDRENELSGYTVEDAIQLARPMKHGPYGAANAELPDPSPEEALALIRRRLAACRFNWITGQRARDVLQQAIENKSVSKDPEQLDPNEE